MNSPRPSLVLRSLALAVLAVQAGIDRMTGRPLPLGMGVDAPVTAATVATSNTGGATATPATPVAETPAAPAAATAPAAPAAPSGVAALLQTAFASVRSRTAVASDLTAARAQIGTLTTERDQARTELATRTTERDNERTAHASTTAQLGAVLAVLGLKPEALAGQNADAVRATVTTHISNAATEQVAALGFNVNALPPQAPGNGGGAAETLEDLTQQMADCKDSVQLGKLAAKAVELRNKAWGAGRN